MSDMKITSSKDQLNNPSKNTSELQTLAHFINILAKDLRKATKNPSPSKSRTVTTLSNSTYKNIVKKNI
ncbi:MAG: hypothetical protein KAR79_03240 [Simkaniaceae bacterium]|nr:hypothetical protein [Simkaniaceae bacterium]